MVKRQGSTLSSEDAEVFGSTVSKLTDTSRKRDNVHESVKLATNDTLQMHLKLFADIRRVAHILENSWARSRFLHEERAKCLREKRP